MEIYNEESELIYEGEEAIRQCEGCSYHSVDDNGNEFCLMSQDVIDYDLDECYIR